MEAGSDSDAASGESSADEDVESDTGVCAAGDLMRGNSRVVVFVVPMCFFFYPTM